jgi:SAM-dependent methyltransferase
MVNPASKPPDQIHAQYAADAERWSEREYANAAAYLRHRADLIRSLGPALTRGARLVDLACGDGALAAYLPELTYVGVDVNRAMVDVTRRRGVEVVEADLNDFRPSEPVEVTALFRAIYYARDRRALFEHVAAYTTTKFVFDFSPRRYAVEEIRRDLLAAGLDDIRLRAFFVPQKAALPAGLLRTMIAFESTVLARLALRFRFTYICAASRRS